MKRLTTDEPYPHGAEGVSEDRLTGRFCRGKFECTALIERLSKYENTGLEPAEIEALKGNGGWELEKMLEEIEKLKEMYKESAFALLDKENLPCEYDECDIESAKVQALSEAIAIIRQHMNDGWIPADDVLPEDDVEVLVTYSDIDDVQYTDIAITTYGYAHLGGNKLDFKEWRSPFEYFRSNYKVIAWQPLPEPYCPERSDNHDGE